MRPRTELRVRPALLVALAVTLLGGSGFGSSADAGSLAAIQESGWLHVCAHPDALPFSSQDPARPGLQLELAGAVARALGVRLQVDWIVFTRHARRVDCDALMGSIVPLGESAARRGQRVTRPYAGGGYQLVVGPGVTGVSGIEDVKGGKIGVEHTSWPHYLLSRQGIATAQFASQTEILKAVDNGEAAAGVVTGPYLGWYLRQHPASAVKAVDAYVPPNDLRWNVAVGLRNADDALLQRVNQILDGLVADGTIQGIFAKYGITYAPPIRP
jgi:ABC-type amino acid transport substrate-binding protein